MVAQYISWFLGTPAMSSTCLAVSAAMNLVIRSLASTGVDQAHAMVNAMSLPIMLVPEVKALVTDLVAADPDKLRRLNLATEIPVNAEGLTMPSNLKLMQQATKNFFTKDNYLNDYLERGIVGSDVQDLKTVLGNVSYSPTKEWAKNVNKAADFLATPVDASERMTRFIAADTARQVLDIAGVPKNHEMYWATISTFTSKVVILSKEVLSCLLHKLQVARHS